MNCNDKTLLQKEINDLLIINSQFIKQEHYNVLLSALKHSRSKEVVEDSKEAINYSKWFAQNIINIQEHLLNKVPNEPDDKMKKYKEFSDRQLIRNFKSIYDGLVYRKLKFDHPFLRYGAEHHFPLNSINSETMVKTMNFLDQFIKSNDGFILVNDLSNFLRVGDFLQINDTGTLINEIKGNFTKVLNVNSFSGSKEPSKQFINKIIPAQEVLDKRIIKANDVDRTEIKIKDVSFTVETYFHELSKLLDKVDKEDYAEIKVDDYLIVRGFNMSEIHKKIIKDKKNMKGYFNDKLAQPTWSTSNILRLSSYLYFTYDGIGNFSRNLLPLSTYPIKEEHIIDLMLGRKVLFGWMNLDVIKNKLESNGWEVEQSDINEIYKHNETIKAEKKMKLFKPFEKMMKDELFTIRRGTYFNTLNISLILKIFTECKRLETILNECECINGIAEEVVNQHYIVRNLEEANVYI
jgi:hypothetical protein